MDQLIPIINKLQDVATTVGLPECLSLPQIVVVGSQSSGKSSVLESIVGRDFLPRGTGIVTRRPLVLQLIRQEGEEYGEFLHIQGAKFSNFDDIRVEIEQATDDMTGQRKGISDVPINLKIYSPHVLDLTLVDLPGVTKVPVGDQPPDIERIVRELVMSYITNPNSIILAISPANADLANSDSLKMAAEVDPHGERTLGVLTKLDIMDAGTDAMSGLRGEVYPLRLGFVGVVCRSQADIVKRVPIGSHLDAETMYFTQHPSYKHIADRCGIPYLSKRLHTLLLSHIKDRIPQLKKSVNELLMNKEGELIGYGQPISQVKEVQSQTLLNIVQKYASHYSDIIDGKVYDASSNELQGGARLAYIFTTIFRNTLMEIDLFEKLTDTEIRTAIMNATGPTGSLFVPDAAFETLVKKQIELLLEPSLQCVTMVHEEMLTLLNKAEIIETERFENLQDGIEGVIRGVLGKNVGPTRDMVENLIQCEVSYINISHPDFIGGSDALMNANLVMQGIQDHPPQIESHIPEPQAPVRELPPASAPQSSLLSRIFGGSDKSQPSAPPEVSQNMIMSQKVEIRSQVRLPAAPRIMRPHDELSLKEQRETFALKELILSYFNIVRKTIGDMVPKICMSFLVLKTKMSLQNELIQNLYKEDQFDNLLVERGNIPQRRDQCRDDLNQLRKAAEILNEVKDYSL